MMLVRAGENCGYVITYLRMDRRPSYPRPALPLGMSAALIGAEKPPVWYFLNLYDAVGADYEWTDQHQAPREELEAYVHHPRMGLWTLLHKGWPAGFYMLDRREEGRCDLAYFGLVPEAIGLGLGKWLLQTSVHAGWDYADTEFMTVQTCTLDHPRALALYHRAGFEPFRQEQKSRILTRDRIIND
jgi:GNAT superfamily N-acetyltransferase